MRIPGVKIIWTGCVVALAVGTASPAAAQRATGPFSGLFGGQRGADSSDTLDVRATLSGAYESDMVPADGPAADPGDGFLQNGTSSAVATTMTYGHRGDRVDIRSSAYGAYRRYTFGFQNSAVPYGGSASIGVKASPRFRIDASADAGYSPFYQLGGLDTTGDVFVNAAFGRSAAAQRNASIDGQVTATASLSQRASLSAAVTGQRATLLDGVDGASTLQDWNGRATFSYRVSRSLAWHAGYGRGEARLDATAPAVVQESFDVGVDYGQTLSFARHTALSFSTSTIGIREYDVTHYRVDGSVRLSRGMSRTWWTYVMYSRSTDYQLGIAQPVLSDTVTAGLSGQLATRLNWTAEAGIGRGSFGFDSNRSYGQSNASVRLEVAVSRKLAWFSQYTYYHDTVPTDIALFAFPQFTRHTATTGLSLWIPVVDSMRPPRDPR